MLRRLRERQADANELVDYYEASQAAMYETLREDGYGPVDAMVQVVATYPCESQHQPGNRDFEDSMRTAGLKYATNPISDRLMNLATARSRIGYYLRWAIEANDEFYTNRFRAVLAEHVQHSEYVPMSPEEREMFNPKPRRRSEPLRATRSTVRGS